MVLHVQVTVPIPQERWGHSATAFTLSAGLVEIVLFGGTGSDLTDTANTTVLRFGECVSCKQKCTFSVYPVFYLGLLGGETSPPKFQFPPKNF